MTQVPPPGGGRALALDVDRSVLALGVALLATAVTLSTVYSRFRPHLDWSNYAVGLLATAGLLGVAVAGLLGIVVPRGSDDATDVVAWPGAFGAVAVGLMISVAMDDSSATAYVAGLVVLAISAAGYVVTRRAPFVVAAIVGFFVAYTRLVDDVVGFGSDDDIGAIGVAVALTVFTVLVTAAGWALPSRALSGVVAGVVAVVGFASLTGVLAIASSFQAALVTTTDGTYDDVRGATPQHPYDNDTWVILGLALLLVVGWAACAAITGHVGFRLLMVAMAASVTPIATLVLRAHHPTWWGVVLGAAGAAALAAVAFRARSRSPEPQPYSS